MLLGLCCWGLWHWGGGRSRGCHLSTASAGGSGWTRTLLPRARGCDGGAVGRTAALGQSLAEGAPGMEAAGEGVLLVALADQAQAARPLVLFGSHVLDIHLADGMGRELRAVLADPGPGLGPPPTRLTWQAFRLSLISTWLVWVPTHM